jgi:hypothetical protein
MFLDSIRARIGEPLGRLRHASCSSSGSRRQSSSRQSFTPSLPHISATLPDPSGSEEADERTKMVAGDKGKVTELLVVDRIHMNRRCFQPSQASRCMCSKVNRSLLNNKRSSLSIQINPSRGCKHLRGSLCGWLVISQRHVPSLYRYFCSSSVIDFVPLFRNSTGPSPILVCQR